MANAGKLMVTLANDTVGQGNASIIDFDFAAGVTTDVYAARALIYLTRTAPNVFAAGTRILGARWRPFGEAGSIDVEFPDAEWEHLVAGVPMFVPPNPHAYGAPLGSGTLAPIGTSVCVSEQTATPGRTGRGRHFLPFISAQAVTADGAFGNERAIDVEADAFRFLIGGAAAGLDPVGFSVIGKAAGAYKPVTNVKVRKNFSSLASRRH
jgi:hypothetical protein